MSRIGNAASAKPTADDPAPDGWPPLMDGWDPARPGIRNIDFWLIRNSLARCVRETCLRWRRELPEGGRVLDVGCGSQPYRPWVEWVGLNYVSIDWPGSEHEFAAPDVLRWDLMKEPWPIEEASVDAVLCTEVLEHVPDPSVLLQQCARSLRDGGSMLVTTPMVWPEHEAPHDYYRFTRFGLQEQLVRAGFRVEWIAPREGWNGTLAMLLGFWARRTVPEPWNYLTRALAYPLVRVLAWRESRSMVQLEMLLTTGFTAFARRPARQTPSD